MSVARSSKEESPAYLALVYWLRNDLLLPDPTAIRVAFGARRLGYMEAVENHIVIWWLRGEHKSTSVVRGPAAAVDLKELAGPAFVHACCVD